MIIQRLKIFHSVCTMGFFLAFWCQIAPEKNLAKEGYKKCPQNWMKSPNDFEI